MEIVFFEDLTKIQESLNFKENFFEVLIEFYFVIKLIIFLNFSLLYRNPSPSQMSETGSLDRMKAQVERRKKVLDETPTVTGLEKSRVNPDKTIDELLRNSKLEQLEEAQECKIILRLFSDKIMNCSFCFF